MWLSVLSTVTCFGVRVLMMFRLMFIHYTFSSVRVAEWPLLGNCCRLYWSVFLIVFCLFIFLFISNFVLRAGFGFWLLLFLFLFIAFLLLSIKCTKMLHFNLSYFFITYVLTLYLLKVTSGIIFSPHNQITKSELTIM